MAAINSAASDNKDAIDFDDIFHPLTKLHSRLFEQQQRSFRENVQPVLINDAVYIQGSDSNDHAVIWKYSALSKKSWSPIPPPKEITDSSYTLTAYQSQLLLIGRKYNREGMLIIMNKFDEDKGWLPIEEVTIPPVDSMQSASDLSAISEGRCLVISWVKDERFQLMVFDGLKWKKVEGPKCRNGYGSSNMIVHEGTLYLSDRRLDSIYSVPLESLLHDGNKEWESLPDLPCKHMLYEGAANLTFLNSSILATLIPSYTRGTSLVLALEPLTKSWIDLGEISCDVGRGASPRLVGLPPGDAGNTRLLAMGQIVRLEQRVPVGGQVLIPYTTLRHNFAILEISATVTKFNYDDDISLRALVKFERRTSYKVLSELEKSQSKKETFMEKARFDIFNKRTQIELYSDVKSAASHVESWISSNAGHTLPPTWDNFLRIILPEIKLSHIAEGIEKYLASTVASTPKETQTEHPKAGYEQVALIGAELDTLSKYLTNMGSHDNIVVTLNEKFKACRDKCHVAFEKLGNEKDEYERQVKRVGELEQQIEQLKQQNDAKHSSDGSQCPPAKKQRTDADTKLTNKHLPILIKKLKNHAAQWRGIGLHLGFLPGELDNIEAKPNLTQGAPLSYLGAMLTEWTQWAPEDSRGSADFATLEDLKTALSDAGLGVTAHELYVKKI